MKEKIFDINQKNIRRVAVFYGTQVPVKKFFNYIEDDKTIESFLTDFPSVKHEQVSYLMRMVRKSFDKYAERISIGSLDLIIEVVCRQFKISPASIKLRSRERKVVRPRQIIMYFATRLTDHSLTEIGNRIGFKNHATVIYACKKIETLLKSTEKFKAEINAIEKEINSMRLNVI